MITTENRKLAEENIRIILAGIRKHFELQLAVEQIDDVIFHLRIEQDTIYNNLYTLHIRFNDFNIAEDFNMLKQEAINGSINQRIISSGEYLFKRLLDTYYKEYVKENEMYFLDKIEPMTEQNLMYGGLTDHFNNYYTMSSGNRIFKIRLDSHKYMNNDLFKYNLNYHFHEKGEMVNSYIMAKKLREELPQKETKTTTKRSKI